MQRLLPGCLGAFGRNKNLDLTIPVAQVGVVSEPSAPLPAKIALPPDAGSFALAINGAARCWATSGPAVVSVPGQLLCGVRSQSRVVYPRGVIHPTEDLSASCIWSGFLYSCPPRPPFIHIIVFQVAIHPLLVLGSLRGKTKDNSHRNKSVHFRSCGLSSHF